MASIHDHKCYSCGEQYRCGNKKRHECPRCGTWPLTTEQISRLEKILAPEHEARDGKHLAQAPTGRGQQT